jgi:hypothetical protein
VNGAAKHRWALRRAAAISVALLSFGGVSAAQEHASLAVGAGAIGLVTNASNTPGNRELSEAYLTQPIVAANLHVGWLQATGMFNFEGATLRRGELDLGEWGEGYVDRRHPHAYVHELMAGTAWHVHGVDASLYAGRGFVPFGSDDPMSRPFVSYPVDHHFAQILERLTAVGAVAVGPLVVEGSIFGGDEPVDPSTLNLWSRFGDSWSMRGTLLGQRVASALSDFELSGSYANVKSPEFRAGQGLDQRKLHGALRMARNGGTVARYALIEIARTTDVDRDRPLYTFNAALAEGALCRRGFGIAARWERSDRPEEERLLDLFRSARPATDLSILGITRWTTVTGAVTTPAIDARILSASPFVEVARITADRTSAALFDPVLFYGSSQMWRVATGMRVRFGHDHGRMGRYGVASPLAPAHFIHHDMSDRNRCFS